MAAGILTLVITFVVAGGLWLGLGAKLKLSDDAQQNDLLNLVTYYAIGLPVVFVVVFTIVG